MYRTKCNSQYDKVASCLLGASTVDGGLLVLPNAGFLSAVFYNAAAGGLSRRHLALVSSPGRAGLRNAVNVFMHWLITDRGTVR